MKTVLISVGIIYVLGFIFFFGFNLAIGPVTPTLALVRGVLWPVWVTTGHPRGVRSVPYGEDE